MCTWRSSSLGDCILSMSHVAGNNLAEDYKEDRLPIVVVGVVMVYCLTDRVAAVVAVVVVPQEEPEETAAIVLIDMCSTLSIS